MTTIPISLLDQIIEINKAAEYCALSFAEQVKRNAEFDAANGVKRRRASGEPQERTHSGLPLGVVKRASVNKGDRFSAVINNRGRNRMLGTFDTPEEAHRAYCKAHIELHGEQSRYWSQRHEL